MLKNKSQREPRLTPVILFSACSVASFLIAVLLWLEVRRTQRALPRMLVTTGIVRELESVLVDRSAAHVRSATLVEVDFPVAGKSHCCTTLNLFAGNRHVGDVGKKFNFAPGQQVGVYYDPVDPRRSALIMDKPRFDSAVITAVVGVIFAILAVVKAV